MASGAERMILEGILNALREERALDRYVTLPFSPEEAASSLGPIAAAAGVEIRWFGVNGPRADAEIVSGDGREWRVVFTNDGVSSLTGLWVFERPAPFRGVEGGVAIVVDGAVGAGKSTLMARFAEAEDTPWVVFDEVNFGHISTNHLIWIETCGPLYKGFLAGIAALAAEGNQVLLPSSGLSQTMLLDAFEGVRTLYVGLECPLAVLTERNRGREGRWGGLSERSYVEFAANGWRYDLLLDSNAFSPDTLVAEVRATLASILQ